ncbi:MAG TPA: FAD-dependent oxidoreductase [Actinomycetota bacterium]|nr:FAD-dependent oxidoreductase [Actinomycetota bacterium]
MSREPVVVVGAGPTGLLLAAELARRGTQVRILERAGSPSQESRANGIHSRTLETLDRLGIARELVALGNPIAAFNIISGGRPILHVDFSRLDGPFPCALIVPQYQTQAVLERYLWSLGVGVERGVEVRRLRQGGDRVVLTTSAGDVEASHVVGCDGAHSTVRHELGLPFEGQGYGQDWLGTDVQVDWEYPSTETHIFASPAGVLGCFPFGGGRWRVMVAQVANRPEERARPGLEEIRELVARRGPAGMRIGDPTWLGAFRASRRSAPRYRVGRVFLAGDAVHIHSPAAGQGMNTGLGDAANLGWKLALVAGGQACDALLDTYEQERAPVARQVIALTHSLVQVFGAKAFRSPAGRRVRDQLLPRCTAEPHAASAIARRFSQQHVSYRGSRLAAGTSRGPVRAGDRAPDVPGWSPAGGASFFDVFQHGGHTLLVAGDRLPGPAISDLYPGLPEDSRAVVVPPGGPAAARYGLRAGWVCLVRPDGYVAYRGPGAGSGGYLEGYLAPAIPSAAGSSGPAPAPDGAASRP